MTQQQFKEARAELGMSQQDFAIALGYKTFVAISRKENGAATITASDEIIIKHLLTDHQSKNNGKRKSRKK